MTKKKDRPNKSNVIAGRRHFLKISGYAVVGVGAWGLVGCAEDDEDKDTVDGGTEVGEIPLSKGYVLVDTKKCQGCTTCMLACSLVHEGVASLSLARLQVMQNSFGKWPDDLEIEQCRQCEDPACLKACPTGALFADTENGNVRRVDPEKCIGCGKCMNACPYEPSLPMVGPDAAYDGDPKSRKCDLCANAPYHWDSKGGGPKGKQACVAVCPVAAIAFTAEMPEQDGDEGYKVNLRDEAWGEMSFPTD